MVSRSGAICLTDVVAKCTMKQNKTETQAKPDEGEAAVAASPSDPKVKHEEASKREVHHGKAARKPAVAASQSKTEDDETARPDRGTQRQDSTSVEYTYSTSTDSYSSVASSPRHGSPSSDVGSPSLERDRRHRVNRSKHRTRRRSDGNVKR